MAACSFSTLLERVTACGLSSCYQGHVEVVSLKECTRHISQDLQLQGLSADKAVDSEFKFLLARAGNVIVLFLELLCSIILAADTSWRSASFNLGSAESRHSRAHGRPVGGGGRDGAVMRALVFHQCGPGSIPGPGVICGLSLLLVLVLAQRVFLRVLPFSSLHKNQHFQIPIRPGRRAIRETTVWL